MYVIVQHQIKDWQEALSRGTRLMTGDGAPDGTRVLQFYPSTGGTAVTCLWEATSVASVQAYVDETLGDTSDNTSYEVEGTIAFSQRPEGLALAPPAVTR